MTPALCITRLGGVGRYQGQLRTNDRKLPCVRVASSLPSQSHCDRCHTCVCEQRAYLGGPAFVRHLVLGQYHVYCLQLAGSAFSAHAAPAICQRNAKLSRQQQKANTLTELVLSCAYVLVCERESLVVEVLPTEDLFL